MSEKNDLPQLMREYREDLRLAAPPPELEDRLKAALRHQRGRGRVIPFPRAWAAAAALVIVGAVAWVGPWRDGTAVATKPPRPVVAERRQEPVLMAEAKPPVERPRPELKIGPVIPPAPERKVNPVIAASPAPSAPPSVSGGLSKEADDGRLARAVTVEQERSDAVESKATAAPPALDAVAPVRQVAVFYKVRKEVRVPGQTPVVTFTMPAAPTVLGFSAAPGAAKAKAVSQVAAPVVVNLGEREILGHLCAGTRRSQNGTTVERWHAKDLGLDLLVKTLTPDGIETIEEITELVRRP